MTTRQLNYNENNKYNKYNFFIRSDNSFFTKNNTNYHDFLSLFY